MLHVESSYRFYGNSDRFFERFGIQFNGEGLYIRQNCVLLAQVDLFNDINPIRVLFYDFPIEETIFSQIHSIPVIYQEVSNL